MQSILRNMVCKEYQWSKKSEPKKIQYCVNMLLHEVNNVLHLRR
jgi:hypothetical protein